MDCDLAESQHRTAPSRNSQGRALGQERKRLLCQQKSRSPEPGQLSEARFLSSPVLPRRQGGFATSRVHPTCLRSAQRGSGSAAQLVSHRREMYRRLHQVEHRRSSGQTRLDVANYWSCTRSAPAARLAIICRTPHHRRGLPRSRPPCRRAQHLCRMARDRFAYACDLLSSSGAGCSPRTEVWPIQYRHGQFAS